MTLIIQWYYITICYIWYGVLPSSRHHNNYTLRSDDHISLVDGVDRHDNKVDVESNENTDHHLNPIRFEDWIDQDYIKRIKILINIKLAKIAQNPIFMKFSFNSWKQLRLISSKITNVSDARYIVNIISLEFPSKRHWGCDPVWNPCGYFKTVGISYVDVWAYLHNNAELNTANKANLTMKRFAMGWMVILTSSSKPLWPSHSPL